MTLSNFLKLSPKRIIQYLLALCNIIVMLFAIVYGALVDSTQAANVFTVLFIIVIFADVIYCGLSKIFFHLLSVAIIAVLVLCNHLCVMNLNSLSSNSVNYLSAFILALIPLVFLSSVIMEILFEGKIYDFKIWRVITFVFKIAAPIALLAFAFLAFDSIYNYGFSVNEYTTTRAGFVFMFLAFAIFMGIIKVYLIEPNLVIKDKLKNSIVHLTVCLAMASFTFYAFAMPLVLTNSDIDKANKACLTAFGDEFSVIEGNRDRAFNISDKFFGIKTDGYTMDKDVVYSDIANGMVLRYDAYIPSDINAHKSVLIYIHGRNGDKGNSKERCRYFASIGYIVFDLQVGDYKEKGINAPSEGYATYEDMVDNIGRFFTFAVNDDRYGADWNSVFISGGSMGGGLTLAFMYGNQVDISGLNITVKGILPIYPGNYDAVITEENAVPCLMLMGTHDGAVNIEVVENTERKYEDIGRDDIATLWINNAGHGCDAIFGDRASQIFIYYAERFMELYR